MKNPVKFFSERIRFDRNEFLGAFGDIGTSLPLLVAVIAASGIDGAKAFIMFGLIQMVTAIIYGVPMSIQPLKAVAMLVIAQKLSGNIIFGAGLSIGIVMLFLTLTGVLEKIGKILPATVIRGIQFGLGIQLATTALKVYIPSEGIPGYVLAGTCAIIGFVLLGNRKYPPALLLIITGIIYAVISGKSGAALLKPETVSGLLYIPKTADIIAGFLLLAIPQIPLSLGNSIYATEKLANEYFPEKKITSRKIGMTYSIMNIINPFLGGLPVCHGSGGMAGHYAFGARTGGSVFIYGLIIFAAGIMGGDGMSGFIAMFPKPVLGAILFFEAIALMSLARNYAQEKNSFSVILLTGTIAAAVPYGYVTGMICGTLLHNFYMSQNTIQQGVKTEKAAAK
ncbi:MAG: putative sulfate/molybdate transporter [Candidatus Goldbacteria bacterium]|nr:putative sulfate/molybdate transporter [Candidatus Goldiibacteriota bacterium]